MSQLLQDLNDAQHKAVTTTEGPILVVAGAGSGKTRVLTSRLAYIITQQLAEPYQILAVTFTNKAAGEMKERVATLLGGNISEMNVSTFHSFCARLLRREVETIGYSSNFVIYDAADSLTLIKSCLKDLNLSTTQFTPKAQLRKISNAKNKMIGVSDFTQQASGYFESTTADIYSLYQERLRECNAMDFDDLLFNAVQLLTHNEDVGNHYRRRFRYILVDEYQDTNHVQYLLLKALVNEKHNICVVGDEDQSIYGWRGADIRNILDFEQDFPGAKLIKLELNYRSTDVILKAASGVIKNNIARKGKILRTNLTGGEKINLCLVDTPRDEATRVIDQIVSNQSDCYLKDSVILYRTNAQSRTFEEDLRRRDIPYQIVGGISFYERKEIKDVLAYLKLISNMHDDVSFIRTINSPKRGIGQQTVNNIGKIARREYLSLYSVALQASKWPELKTRVGRIKGFTDIIEKFRKKNETTFVDILTEDLIEDLKIIEELQTEDKITGQTRVENVAALIDGMTEYANSNESPTLVNYLAEISLFIDLDSYAEIEDKLTLMTIHTAKGLEYSSVFLVGLEEGLFPLARSISDPEQLEEERRLFYVGATRAARRLYLSAATNRHRFNSGQSAPSRFIKEIPKELIETFDYRIQFNHQLRWHNTSEESKTRSMDAATEGIHYEYEGHEAFRIGRIVQHPTFGRGKIFEVEGYGESLTLTIMFTGIGRKKIMVKYAQLSVIG
ncbi:MAG: UvrD-helicase domain-containing protein [candidate division Zixibacteria bacterium]|nr:UvrD-helicase domain-containing protein [candidate division Zixibacteria bacterium]